MKISILTPSYNAAACIERAILSVVAQDYADWEHVVIDGGSTDGTLEVLGRYPHVKWISEPDKGIYDAMNKGIARAQGDWIYFLGADDYLLDERVLSGVAAQALRQGAGAIYGNVISPRFGGRYRGEFSYTDLLRRNICHQSIFLHRTVFEKVGGFNLRYAILADWDHNIRWFSDPSIKRQYIALDVAQYADGGFSSRNNDPLFVKERGWIVLVRGRHFLDPYVGMGLAKQETLGALSRFRLVRALRAMGLYVFFRIQSRRHA